MTVLQRTLKANIGIIGLSKTNDNINQTRDVLKKSLYYSKIALIVIGSTFISFYVMFLS